MDATAKAFRDWMLEQEIGGAHITEVDHEHYTLAVGCVEAFVNFYCMAPEPDIVELRVERDCNEDDEPETLFFLHFELVDLERAKALFTEMAEAVTEIDSKPTTEVLLCCTAGLTTSMFAEKMNEAADALGIAYHFSALPIDEALAHGDQYAAVLIAPQVGHRRRELDDALPEQVPVIELPAKIFGSFDGAGAVRLTLDALGERALLPGEVNPDLRIMRDVENDKRIMVIAIIHTPRIASMEYRVCEKGETLSRGRIYKKHFGFEDIEDMVASARMDGIHMSSIDAIGIAFPGVVNRGSVAFGHGIFGDYDLGRRLEQKYGVEVFIDNNANAAAVGCYVTQDQYDSVLFHTQQTGAPVGGEGLVVDGHLVKGRKNAAGELAPVARRFKLSQDIRDACWDSEGMVEIVANHLAAGISTVAPDAIFVSVRLIPDMEPLRAELAKTMPEDFIPDLIPVTDYRERMLIGELVLCLQKLKNPRPHRKW